MRSFMRIRHVLMGAVAAVKVLKNAKCLITGYLVDMEISVTGMCIFLYAI